MFDQLAGLFVRNLQLQKSPSRILGQNSGNSVDISKVFFEIVIWKFESSQVSQAVRRSEKSPLTSEEMPANGGFCDSGNGLQAPDFANCGPELPKVSGRTPKYSRFLETGTGDRVRSPLRERGHSANKRILRSSSRTRTLSACASSIDFVFC